MVLCNMNVGYVVGTLKPYLLHSEVAGTKIFGRKRSHPGYLTPTSHLLDFHYIIFYVIASALLHVNIKRTMVLYFIVCIAASDSLDEPEMKRSRSSSIAKEPEGKRDV